MSWCFSAVKIITVLTSLHVVILLLIGIRFWIQTEFQGENYGKKEENMKYFRIIRGK